MADELEQMLADEGAIEAPEVEQEVAPEPIAEPVAEAIEPPPETPEVEAAPERPEPGFIPIAAYLTEREKRQAAEAEANKFRQQQPQPSAPDPYDNPDGYTAWQDQRFQAGLFENKVAMSRVMATEKHGGDAVQSAITWATERAASNPAFEASTNAELVSQPHPIDWLVQQHKRDTDLAEYTKDPVAFARRVLEANGQPLATVAAAASAVAPPKQAAPPVRVPRSLATQGSGPSDVRDVATGPLAAVDAVFPQ